MLVCKQTKIPVSRLACFIILIMCCVYLLTEKALLMKGMIATDITFQDSYFSRDKNQISLTNKYKRSDLVAACNVKLQPHRPTVHQD